MNKLMIENKKFNKICISIRVYLLLCRNEINEITKKMNK